MTSFTQGSLSRRGWAEFQAEVVTTTRKESSGNIRAVQSSWDRCIRPGQAQSSPDPRIASVLHHWAPPHSVARFLVMLEIQTAITGTHSGFWLCDFFWWQEAKSGGSWWRIFTALTHGLDEYVSMGGHQSTGKKRGQRAASSPANTHKTASKHCNVHLVSYISYITSLAGGVDLLKLSTWPGGTPKFLPTYPMLPS